MNNYYLKDLKEFKCEKFELALNVEESRISSKELRSYLLQFEKLVDSINQTLNDYNDLGYDAISIDVVALEQGSFKIPLIFKKYFNSKNYEKIIKITENSTAAIVIGHIIISLLTGKPYSDVEMNYDAPRTLEETFLRDSKTAKAVKKIAELAIYNDSIHDLSITYEGNEGEQKITISKESLHKTKDAMDEVILFNESPHHLNHVYLKIISPARKYDNDDLWTFRFHGKLIDAIMYDHGFQRDFDYGRIYLKKGDKIMVDMIVEGHGRHKIYNIIKVYYR